MDKIKLVLVIIILAVSALCIYQYNSSYTNKKTYQSEKVKTELEYQEKVKNFSYHYDSLNSVYTSLLSKYNFIDSASKIKKNDTKIYERVIYKDSIKEVYIEHSEYEKEMEAKIVALEDSLSKRTDVNVVKDSVIKYDTVYVKEKEKTESVKKTETIVKEKKFNIYADGTFTIDKKLNTDFGASAGVDYKVLGPVFLGVEASKKGFSNWTDGYSIKGKTGLRLQFWGKMKKYKAIITEKELQEILSITQHHIKEDWTNEDVKHVALVIIRKFANEVDKLDRIANREVNNFAIINDIYDIKEFKEAVMQEITKELQ